MKTSDIKGIIPPVITPMNDDAEQTVNHEELRKQVERLLAGGVHGIFPLGTNGEAYALSAREKEEILATVIDQVKGRVPVYAGTGCITTAETIRMSKRAEELGADALSIITPSFAVASQKELYDHYVAVAKHVNIPIILYNIPPRTGNKLLPETVQALCRDVDVIVGAKDSSGDIENLKAYIRLTKELDKDVAILAGNDGAILTCLKEGGAGGIAGRANIWPHTIANMPCIVRNLTDDEAITQMVEDNLNQREEILPSERAKALKMQLEAIKHQGSRTSGQIDPKDAGKRSNEIVAERNKMAVKQVQRYIRLNELVPDLMKLMDEKKLGFTTAVELSYIGKKNQNYIAVAIDSQQSSPSQAQAKRMRELDEKKLLNGDVIDGIMMEDKKEVDKVILTGAELSKYFGKETTPREMKDQIIKLLDDWKGQQKEHEKPEKKTEQEK